MKKTKNTIIIITFLILLCFLTGCIFIKDKNRGESYDKSVEILRCFDKKDAEGLKKHFCQYTKEDVSIDAEIHEAFDFFKGKSVYFKFAYNGGIAGSWRDGKAVDEHIEPEIQDISTELGNTYRIYFHEYLTYEKDKKCVGITHMIVFDENTDEAVQIGEYVY